MAGSHSSVSIPFRMPWRSASRWRSTASRSWPRTSRRTWTSTCARTRRSAPPEGPRRSIDVLVCSYNESLDLVRQTLRCALAIRGPHRTWLLDDGDRPAARALAAELGCDYLSRQRNTDFKAGNLNHALAHTDAELVLVLDADHLVRPEIVERLAGYFADPAVALVQTPQVFYNVDSFQHHFRAGERRLWHEGAVFHHAMQPGADRWNAAFFVGTGAILRRSALERIGGLTNRNYKLYFGEQTLVLRLPGRGTARHHPMK